VGKGVQAVGGNDLVTLSIDETTNQFLLQLSPLQTLRRGQVEQSLEPTSQLWLDATPQPIPKASRPIIPAALAADAQSVIIAEEWMEVENVYLHWLAKTNGGIQASSVKRLELKGYGPIQQVMVDGRFALVMTQLSKLLLIENISGAELIVKQLRTFPVTRLLRWSKDFIYLANASDYYNTASLEVLSPVTLDTVASYPLADQATTLAEVGERFIVSVWNGLHVLTPPCE
jgi:hypothetical protein